MNRKIFTWLIILMGISILGIIAVQLVWMNNAIRVKNELFNRSVNEALNNTVNKLEDLHNFKVVNQMVMDESMNWKSLSGEEFDYGSIPPPPPPPPVLVDVEPPPLPPPPPTNRKLTVNGWLDCVLPLMILAAPKADKIGIMQRAIC